MEERPLVVRFLEVAGLETEQDVRQEHRRGGEALTEAERVELLRLRKEVAELKMDRAFLKKASLFFAQEASDTNGKRSS